VRVFRDGFELFPMRGGVVDLSFIGLSGVEEVRVDRFLSEVHIRITSLEPSDVRPLSMIETGQGDFNTNLFRGMLLLPNALGGSVSFGIDRVDTRGSRGEESGVIQGASARYGRHWGDDATVFLEYRTLGVDRDTLYTPGKLVRGDLSLRGSVRLGEGLVGAFGYLRSSLRPESGSGGLPVDSTIPSPDLTQAVARLSLDRGTVRALAEGRWMDGRGAPSTSGRVGIGLERPEAGRLWAEGDFRKGDLESGWTTRLVAQTARFGGLSGFASLDQGEVPTTETRFLAEVSPAEGDSAGAEPSSPLFPGRTTRDGVRAGADFERWGVQVGGAWLRVEASESLPLGLTPDESPFVVGLTTLEGYEVTASVPLYFDGLSAGGMLTRWDEPEGMYLPDEQFSASVRYHNVFRENGVLELWLDGGAEGRSSMLVPGAPGGEEAITERVDHQINWFGRVQLRIATVRIFLNWDNLAYREMDADIPGRFLPSARALWGVRWTLWN